MSDEDDLLTITYLWAFERGKDSAKARIETLEQAIRDWADAIVDWEGVDFVERIKNEKSRVVIEAALTRGEKR